MIKEELVNSNWRVRKGRIIRVKRMTPSEKLFEIELDNGRAMDYEPGQFVQVSVFGVGEAPISLCSSPTKRGSFELCVRAAGRVTNAMHALEAGDEIGIRGPFGKGFPVKVLAGNDLIFVAGGLGIAPLRSLINYVIDNRREFGKVDILLGCRNPSEMLFADDLEFWQKRVDVNFNVTVDKGSPDWAGNIGLITSIIPGVTINPERTFAVVVGPPVMYKFVISELLKKKIAERNIILSLERHMKCGMGKCGHCQIDSIDNYYCCQDGPVFSYDRIKNVAKM
ncbi:MAG: FAD/NAD(P)-binding protein [Elusimicrobia bacterium]|nr:FAD/NAD(P)-binding protein [Elusimicrobiota bacterium]